MLERFLTSIFELNDSAVLYLSCNLLIFIHNILHIVLLIALKENWYTMFLTNVVLKKAKSK